MANRNPDISGFGPSRRSVGYVEQAVNHWIICRIKGIPWVPEPMPAFPQIIRKPEVRRRVGVSDVTLWTWEKKGIFPKRIYLTDKRAEAADGAAD
jgi:predicted DNA-binding transcriptional regulator AlpA